MNHNEQIETLRAIVSSVSRRDASRVELDDDLVPTLSLDSLAGLRVLAAVEKRFGVRFPDERLSELRTLRQLLDFIQTTASNRESGEKP